jgi:TonB-linked SusC/RagA family outer membrane protein
MHMKILMYYLVLFLLMFSLPFGVMSQDSIMYRVTGVVHSSATGQPIGNINIEFPGLRQEPSGTDSTGHFEIVMEKPFKAVAFSFPGYHTVNQLINSKQKDLVIWLTPTDFNSLSTEVKVAGRSLPQNELSGSLLTIPNRELDKMARATFEPALQGKVAGLQVIGRSGMPGEGSFLHVHGYNSLYSTSLPLVVVDGMIIRSEGFGNSIIGGFHQDPLSDINLNNVSTITVLKDATETSWYGIKGGNGVILITTDQPATGKTTLDVNIAGGVASFNRSIPVMSADLSKSYLMEQMYDAGMSDEQIFSAYPFMKDNKDYLDYEKYNNNTDWQDEIFRNGMLTEANLKVRGGDERAMYAITGGYISHNGVIQNTGYKRFNFQFNSLVNVSPRVKIGLNIRFANSRLTLAESGSLYQTNPVFASLIKAPFLAVYQQDQQGNDLPVTEDKDEFGFSNPYVVVHKVDATNQGIAFTGFSYLNYQITNDLALRVTLGIDRNKANERLFVPSWGIAPQGNGSAQRSMKNKVDEYYSIMNEDYLNYDKTFNTIHHLSADAGVRIFSDQLLQEFGLAQNSATDEFRNLNTGRSDEVSFGGYEIQSSWINYYTAIRYKLKDKYLASFFMSVDGSSRFGAEVENGIRMYNHPFAVLPVAGLAWRISKEPFLQNVRWLNELKLKASYGLSGSDDYPDYAGISKYNSIQYYQVTGFYMAGIANPRIQWETYRKFNAGLEASAFGDKVIFMLDLYRDHTLGMITHLDLPAWYGYDQYLSNDGECRNTGIDMDLYIRPVNKTFKWEADLNFSQYRNEVISAGQDQVITQFTGGEKITLAGQPFGMFYGYHSLGIFKTVEDAAAAGLTDKAGRPFEGGDMHFEDLDGNHIINESDKMIIGNPHPKFYGGFYNKFTWRSFSLSAQISYTFGNTVFNYMRSQTESMSGYENQSASVYDRWVKNNQETNMPKSAYGDPMGNARFSNRWLEDGSYVRLNSLIVSYTYPGKLFFIRNMTVYFTGNNLVTWSKYLGYDPEFSYADSAPGQGIDYGKMPQPRSVVLGIKLGL